MALCTIVAHNIAQNRPDSFPSYPPDNHHCSDDVYLREGTPRTDRQTHRRAWPQYILRHLRLTQNATKSRKAQL